MDAHDMKTMSKLILMAALLLPGFARADAYDLMINQRNPTDTGNIPRTIPSPVTDGLLYYDVGTLLPKYVTLGTGLSITSSVISASGGAAQVQTDWNAFSGLAVILNKPTIATVGMTGQYGDLTGIPSTFAPAAHTQAFSTITSTPTTLAGYGITDAYPLSGNPSAYITQAGARSAISLTTTGSGAATYNSSTGILNVPTPAAAAAPSQSAAMRTLNSAFQISTTRNTLVSYSVQLTVTASIAGGQNGDVILEIASDSGFTSNVQTLAITGLGQTYTLAVALQGVQPQTGVVSGFVPTGYYARLRTANNTGTPAYAYRAGQEIQL